MKLKRPTTPEEVLEYGTIVSRELFQLLKKKMEVSIGGTTEQELFSIERVRKASKKGRWDGLNKEILSDAMKNLRKGVIPSVLKLSPIIFNSSAAMESGVPYLEVAAVSWLNTETPKTLAHTLLTLMQSPRYNHEKTKDHRLSGNSKV